MTGRITLRERIGLCLGRWQLRRRSRNLTAAQLLAADWLDRSVRVCKELQGRSEKLVLLSATLKRVSDAVDQYLADAQSSLNDAKMLADHHTTALESLRSENTILGVEVDALTHANQLALERYRADIAVQTMRQVAVTGEEKQA